MEGLYRKVVRGQYPRIPAHYSQDLADVIAALLQVHPRNRPAVFHLCQLGALGIVAVPLPEPAPRKLETALMRTCSNELMAEMMQAAGSQKTDVHLCKTAVRLCTAASLRSFRGSSRQRRQAPKGIRRKEALPHSEALLKWCNIQHAKLKHAK
eukprot:g4359.t1